MGKKYIIELEEVPFIQHFKNGAWETIYRVKGFNSLVFDWNGLNMLTPYTEPDLEQVRKEAYDTAYADAEEIYASGKKAMYQKGLKDAWEAARKIAYMYSEERNKIFGENLIQNIHDIYSASECIEKIKQYEQRQEEQIQVGDEVITASGKAVVMGVGPVHFEYVCADGSIGYDEVKNVKKTGRTFPEIAEVLQRMKEADNG